MYVGLDIGTTSVKVVVAEYIEGQMNIIGVGNAKSDGLNRGIVVDIDQTVQAIQRAVRQAEEKAGIQIKSVNVGLPANLLEVESCQGMIAVSSESKKLQMRMCATSHLQLWFVQLLLNVKLLQSYRKTLPSTALKASKTHVECLAFAWRCLALSILDQNNHP